MNRFFTFLLLGFAIATTAQPDLNFNKLYSVNSTVTVIENAYDNRLFIGRKTGEIYVAQSGSVDLNTAFLDISGKVSTNSERGLLGMAFHPNYTNNGYFYLNYTNGSGNTVIARYSVSNSNPNVADANSELILMTIDQPFSNHNGGDITFGADGYLYIATGDGGSGGDPEDNGQDDTQLLGKILRIDVDNTTSNTSNLCGTTGTANYAIPANNPFVGNDGQCDEIYATGLRNPWRISFDNDGDLWIADVGQNAYEEINLYQATATAGLDFGWDCLEGFEDYDNLPNGFSSPGSASADCSQDPTNNPNYTDPVYAYAHNLVGNGGGSITGGFLYEGTQIDGLQNYYLFADISDGTFSALNKASALTSNPMVRTYDNFPGLGVTTFGEDQAGEVYFGDFSGDIYQVSSTALPLTLVNFSANKNKQRGINLTWQVTNVNDVDYFTIEKSETGKTFSELAKIPIIIAKSQYQFTDVKPFLNNNFYRLKIVDSDGSFTYSNIISQSINTNTTLSILPNPNRGQFLLSLNNTINSSAQIQIRIYDNLGQIVQTYPLEMVQFPYEKMVDLSGKLSAGIYTVEVNSEAEVYRQQIIVE